MKKKKGFTLIELLAVIVILAIIALIAVPVIMNIISKARKSAFEDTAYGLISAGEMYYAEKLLDAQGMIADKEFIFDGTNIPEGLNVKGSVPTGKMTVTKDGKIAIAVNDGAYCITKATSESKITLVEKEGACDYKRTANPIISSATTCVMSTTETCSNSAIQDGIAVSVKVNDTETKTFYVVKDENNTLTLLMDSNLGNAVKWISEETYGCGVDGDYCSQNDKGPIIALDALEDRTKEWTNLPKGYTTEDDNATAKYSPITRSNARARLIKKSEIESLYDENHLLPDWAYSTTYWTSSADAGSSDCAWIVGGNFALVDYGIVYGAYGLRPVIEIAKSII